MFDTIRMGSSAQGEEEFYDVAKSCMFPGDEVESRMYRTLGTPTDHQKWTLSMWFKRQDEEVSSEYWRTLFAAGSSSSYHGYIMLKEDRLRMYTSGNWDSMDLQTNALYRERNEWYHLVVAVDTTQATDTDRVKMYINGAEPVGGYHQATYPSQNSTLHFNANILHSIGSYAYAGPHPWIGFISEFAFVDGVAHPPTKFGKFSRKGKWVPIELTGITWGDNGSYLQFGSSGNLGDDTSGQTHDYTLTNISSWYQMLDTPSNPYSMTNMNFRWYSNNSSRYTYCGHGSQLTKGGSGTLNSAIGNLFALKGKYFFEGRYDSTYTWSGPSGAGTHWHEAYGQMSFSVINPNGNAQGDMIFIKSGTVIYGLGWTTESSSHSATSAGQIFSLAVDYDNKTGKFWVDGSSINASIDWGDQNNFNEDNELSLPTHGSGGTNYGSGFTINNGTNPTFNNQETAGGNADANGHGNFSMAVPSGYLAFCKKNIDLNEDDPHVTPSITDPTKKVGAALWTGNDGSQSISLGFQPAVLFIKNRTQSDHWQIHDVARGVDYAFTNGTDASTDNSSSTNLSFTGSGFDLNNSLDAYNKNSETYFAYGWKNSASAASNSDGSISSTVRYDSEVGMSIIQWTGNATGGATVGHGLGEAPGFIMAKGADSGQYWAAGGTTCDGNKTQWNNMRMRAEASDSSSSQNNSMWYKTAATSTVFYVGAGTGGVWSEHTNKSSVVHTAYAWKEIKGFSRFSQYRGNGNADGQYVFLGFEPAIILIKRIAGADDFLFIDNKRNTYNQRSAYTLFNDGNPTESTSNGEMDFYKTGFKIRTSNSQLNTANEYYLYAAWAHKPMAYNNPQ